MKRNSYNDADKTEEISTIQLTPPSIRHNEDLESPTLPLPPPKDRETIEEFLSYIGNLPRERVAEVRETISAIEDKQLVASLLNEILFEFPCTDVTQHLILLSVIGELGEKSSIDTLHQFIWLTEEQIFHEELIEGKTCSFSTKGILQARSAEMLVWVLKGSNDEQVLEIIQKHPLRVVKLAAIDSYLFQHNDDKASIKFLRDQLNEIDQAIVGLPRFESQTDRKTFDQLREEFDTLYLSKPPLPEKAKTNNLLKFCIAFAVGVAIVLPLHWKK